VAGRKLSAKAEEEVVFMEHLLLRCDSLLRKVEEYATATRNVDGILMPIVRDLQQIRQQAMMKNLGPVADQAGMLGVAAGRGSQMQRTRVLREGINSFKQMVERVIKATVDVDQRKRAEAERAMGKPEGAH